MQLIANCKEHIKPCS